MSVDLVAVDSRRIVCRIPFDLKDLAKQAGFRWDPAFRRWWTTEHTAVTKLIKQCRDARISIHADADTQKIIEDAQKSVALSSATQATVAIPAPDGLDYLPYQRAGIQYAMSRRDVLIGDEMGLGKTIQAIGIINADKLARSVLVIAPASLKPNWKRELEKWLAFPRTVEVCNGKELPTSEIVILNYEQVGKLLPQINARRWDILVCDEAHYLKNGKSQRTRAVLGDKNNPGIAAKRRVFLTGTPILNRPIELWPLVQVLDPDGLGASWFKFVTRYCNGVQTKYGWNVSGASNLSELQERLRASCMVRRLKADVLKELPPKRRSVVVLDPGMAAAAVKAEAEAMRAYLNALSARSNAVAQSQDQTQDAQYREKIKAMKDAEQLLFNEMTRRRHEAALKKAPLVVDYINAIEPDKLVVMCWHKDVAQIIYDAFGDSAVLFTGDVTLDARDTAVQAFQNDPKVRIFVGTIASAGVGLTLTAASTVLFAEIDWVPGNMSQAEDRVHRVGQTNSVNVVHLVLDGSPDVSLAEALIRKQEIITRALDTSPGTAAQADPAVAASALLRDAFPQTCPQPSLITLKAIKPDAQ